MKILLQDGMNKITKAEIPSASKSDTFAAIQTIEYDASRNAEY